ncbi:MAG: winged helix-turn-helix domain-containing protein [Planctomycetia bacterium]|nr:winged helix-turn-helix domain-containing protein [Planctomycetia bacterium]
MGIHPGGVVFEPTAEYEKAVKKDPSLALTPEDVKKFGPKRNAAGIRMTPLRATEIAAKKAKGTAKSAKGGKPTRKATKEPTKGKMSGLDAAATVLAKAGKPLTCREIVTKMFESGVWKSSGRTPHATIYSAMLRDIDGNPGESRFEKTGRGLFALAKR